MQEVTPERKSGDSTTGKGGFMVITLTPIYPVVLISLNLLPEFPNKSLMFMAILGIKQYDTTRINDLTLILSLGACGLPGNSRDNPTVCKVNI